MPLGAIMAKRRSPQGSLRSAMAIDKRVQSLTWKVPKRYVHTPRHRLRRGDVALNQTQNKRIQCLTCDSQAEGGVCALFGRYKRKDSCVVGVRNKLIQPANNLHQTHYYELQGVNLLFLAIFLPILRGRAVLFRCRATKDRVFGCWNNYKSLVQV